MRIKVLVGSLGAIREKASQEPQNSFLAVAGETEALPLTGLLALPGHPEVSPSECGVRPQRLGDPSHPGFTEFLVTAVNISTLEESRLSE